MGALEKIQAAHINVYLSEFTTVAAYKAGRLKLVTPQTACCLRGKRARPCSGNPCSSSLEGGRSRR